MNALEKITLEIKAIFLHLPQQELTSLELINFSKGHEGPDMGWCVYVWWRWWGVVGDRVVSSKIPNKSCKIKIHHHLINRL